MKRKYFSLGFVAILALAFCVAIISSTLTTTSVFAANTTTSTPDAENISITVALDT